MAKDNSLLLGHIELTKKQKEFYDIMTDDKTRIVFVGGPAGTAKTFLSVYSALDLYNRIQELKDSISA
jgi:phosphate starvation-inducible protein PhoH